MKNITVSFLLFFVSSGSVYCSTFVHLTQYVNLINKQNQCIAVSATKVKQYTAPELAKPNKKNY